VVEILLVLVVVLLAAVVALQLRLLARAAAPDPGPLAARLDEQGRGLERVERALREEMSRGREETDAHLRRTEEGLVRSVAALGEAQKGQSETLSQGVDRLVASNEARLESVRATVEERLKALGEDNAKRLDQMRGVVDEKLQATLDRRLGESFKSVGDRLQEVHLRLGEMQTLAGKVGDLKNVLTNVRTRGTWGEIQLGALLESVLAPHQYEASVAVRPGSREKVDFAVRLPGREGGDPVWLPIDAKFPKDDYDRLVEASARGDAAGVEAAGAALETQMLEEARTLQQKYLCPPHTTDFGILFLPSESLYAEVLRRPGLAEKLQDRHRMVVAGPVTLGALLNSLRLGFRTLAIEEKTSEVWRVLRVVKVEVARLYENLAKAKKKVEEAGDVLEDATGKQKRTLDRHLESVEALPAPGDAPRLVEAPPPLEGPTPAPRAAATPFRPTGS
jgi:DNA recombination protein RmuC